MDIAELSALRVLACVQRQVKELHPAGLDIRLRLEDNTGYYLEGKSDGVVNSIEKYITDMCSLIRVLGYDDFITPIRESSIVNYDIFADDATALQPFFYNYLMESEIESVDNWENITSYKTLAGFGWKGIIPPEMREYYHHRYRILFPDMTTLERVEAIAKYFSSTLARHRALSTAVDPNWNGRFIQIAFTPPVLGEPLGLINTRIHYRTVPLTHTKKH